MIQKNFLSALLSLHPKLTTLVYNVIGQGLPRAFHNFHVFLFLNQHPRIQTNKPFITFSIKIHFL